MSKSSSSKGAMNNIPYLICTVRELCGEQMSPQATFYCVQCSSLLCSACEKEIHRHSDYEKHERLNLNEMDDEHCSINKSHQAVFYCPTCASSFCYPCFENQHQHSDGKGHKPQKCREGPLLTSRKKTDQHRAETKPIKINSTTNGNNTNMAREQKSTPKGFASSFEDVKVNDSDESFDSPPIQQEYSTKTKTSNSAVSRHSNGSIPNPKQHTFNQQMLLDSLIDDDDDEDQVDNNRATKKPNRVSKKRQSNSESNDVFLLIDANEHLTVNSDSEFIRQLNASSQNPPVKCISIIGNTGDGKSYTLNKVFFDGNEKFSTSSTADSCTMGVWAALDEQKQTLVLDTEGRLGLSQNDNIRNRLLLKILCISDVVIFRTKAPKLPNDMFQFLSDASNAFLKYFRKELENVMKNCNVDGPMSAMGPTLVVFHETQHTEVLTDHFQGQKTAVEQLKERFEKMKLSYDAYRTIEYVGIQTEGGKDTDFSTIKATITAVLEDNKIRSPRNLSVIFKSLKALNEKFNHAIPPEMPSTLPDDFFACCMKCLACNTKCAMPANHQKENIPHQCDKKCAYDKELNNEVWKCLACHREGRDMIVYGKLNTKGDSLVQGLVKYVWSGFVIECPLHGEIYRSRKYWYGNNEPKDVTRVEVIHVWPGDDTSRLSSDVTPRKFMEMFVYAGSYLSAPAKMLTETIADQVAPSYWIPNKDVHRCSSCNLQFGSDFSKHHCRACGHVFCDTCTAQRRIVSWIDINNPVRVCDNCYGNPKSCPPSSVSNSYSSTSSDKEKQSDNQRTKTSSYGDSGSTASSGPVNAEIPTTRRVYETFRSGLEKIGATYPIDLLKDSTRPNYWKPDHECRTCFICKGPFNSTNNRLHHCRKCGDGVCESCSPNKRPVPERDWTTPVRVCNSCDQAMNESNQ